MVIRLLNRRGASSMGCLTTMILFGIVGYVGLQVGEPYYRYYQYKDAIEQEARFASLRDDDAIKKNLYSTADSLGLAEDAYHIKIIRTPTRVRIQTSYEDSWTIGP